MLRMNFIIVDDDPQTHRAGFVFEEFMNHKIKQREWPTESSDKNASENIRSRFKVNITKCKNKFTNFVQLMNAVLEKLDFIF